MLSERWIRRETTLTGSRALSHSNKAPSTQQKLETFLIVGKIYNLKIEKKKDSRYLESRDEYKKFLQQNVLILAGC